MSDNAAFQMIERCECCILTDFLEDQLEHSQATARDY
jgi:hypothetical protein